MFLMLKFDIRCCLPRTPPTEGGKMPSVEKSILNDNDISSDKETQTHAPSD